MRVGAIPHAIGPRSATPRSEGVRGLGASDRTGKQKLVAVSDLPCQQPGIRDVCEDRKRRISCQNKIHPPWPAGRFILIFGEMRCAGRERRWDAARGAVWRRQSLLYEPDANRTAARSWHCAVAPTLTTMIVLPQSFAGDQTWLRYTTLRDVRRRTPSSSTSAGVFPMQPRLQISPATRYSAEFGV